MVLPISVNRRLQAVERASLARPWSAREHRDAHPIFVSALLATSASRTQERSQTMFLPPSSALLATASQARRAPRRDPFRVKLPGYVYLIPKSELPSVDADWHLPERSRRSELSGFGFMLTVCLALSGSQISGRLGNMPVRRGSEPFLFGY